MYVRSSWAVLEGDWLGLVVFVGLEALAWRGLNLGAGHRRGLGFQYG